MPWKQIHVIKQIEMIQSLRIMSKVISFYKRYIINTCIYSLKVNDTILYLLSNPITSVIILLAL